MKGFRDQSPVSIIDFSNLQNILNIQLFYFKNDTILLPDKQILPQKLDFAWSKRVDAVRMPCRRPVQRQLVDARAWSAERPQVGDQFVQDMGLLFGRPVITKTRIDPAESRQLVILREVAFRYAQQSLDEESERAGTVGAAGAMEEDRPALTEPADDRADGLLI